MHSNEIPSVIMASKVKEAREWGNLNFGGGSPRIDGHGRMFYGTPRLIEGYFAPAHEVQPYE
jgi:hypothetical protein